MGVYMNVIPCQKLYDTNFNALYSRISTTNVSSVMLRPKNVEILYYYELKYFKVI